MNDQTSLSWNETQPQISKYISEQKVAEAWEQLLPFEEKLRENKEVAKLWVTLLQLDPSKESLIEDAKIIFEHWGQDLDFTIAVCDALNRLADRRPFDEPPWKDGPAVLAEKFSSQSLQSNSHGSLSNETKGYLWINMANALRAQGTSKDKESLNAYKQALKLCPEKDGWWLDFSTLHKWRGRWQEAMECARKVKESSHLRKAACANIAICATAMGKGDIAVDAWNEFGVSCELHPKNHMPLIHNLAPVQVRVPSRASGLESPSSAIQKGAFFEIAWVAPLSPCHGVIQTPTFHDALADFGDVVIWDVAPVSVIKHENEITPRFPLLGFVHQGTELKLPFITHEKHNGALNHFFERLPENTLYFMQRERLEQVESRNQTLDKTTEHAQTTLPEGLQYGKIVVTQQSNLSDLKEHIEQTLSANKSNLAFAIPELYEKLKETKKAGQQHQAWRGIEKKAYK